MLIAIEGVDKSGKETQTALLLERLHAENKKARKIEFPNYPSEAAGAIRMYLNGEFGTNPDDVNPYAASVFFAVDRYASYKTDWGRFLDEGGIIIADRYTMSNMIHQGAKFSDASDRRKYIEWLTDLEFCKIGLPKPDIVIFLDLSMELRIKLLEKTIQNAPAQAALHPQQRGGSDKHYHVGDIHERDLEYLHRSHVCAREVAALLGWKHIDVGHGASLRPAQDIHSEIYAAIYPLL